MKKRNLVVTLLAATILAQTATPLLARAEQGEDFQFQRECKDLEIVWRTAAGVSYSEKFADIPKQENESDYAYYNRVREYALSAYTLVQNVPSNTEEAMVMGQKKQLNSEELLLALVRILSDNSEIMYSTVRLGLDGLGHAEHVSRCADLTNEFGQIETVSSIDVNCVCEDTWTEKGIAGAVKLDGTLYAIKRGVDAPNWATLIPYTDLGCQNCQFDLTWNYNTMAQRRYMGAGRSTLGTYDLEVYDSDGSFNYDDVYMVRWKTGNIPWEVQGVTQYYCEHGVITPMTESLHNTLPNNEFVTDYLLGMEAEGARRFIE